MSADANQLSELQRISLDAPSAKEAWNATEYWCILCQEPFNAWNDHRGKKDHIVGEMFYDEFVHLASTYHPHVRERLDGRAMSAHLGIDGVHEVVRKADYERRHDVIVAAEYLVRHGYLTFETRYRPAHEHSRVQSYGAMVLFKHQNNAIASMFPYSNAKQISGLAQLCASLYNTETVFDVCGLRHLVPATVQTTGMIDTPIGTVPDVGYGYKGSFVRALLGQLRWAVDTTVPFLPHKGPLKAKLDASGRPPGHIETMSAFILNAIVTETIALRCQEFITRIEPVWRQLGCKAAPRLRSSAADDGGELAGLPPRGVIPLVPEALSPRQANIRGPMGYLAGKLHNTLTFDAAAQRWVIPATGGVPKAASSSPKDLK